MAELLIVRHGQASFGADNYDLLSDLGTRQSEVLGALLRDLDWVPDRIITGTLQRQKQTLEAMGFDGPAEEHAGFNEYDFHDLLAARFQGAVPEAVKGERKAHFRTLRETVFAWQDDEISGVSETYATFCARVEAARTFACSEPVRRVLVISSGGVIGQLTATALSAGKRQMMELNLQVKNTSLTRFMFKDARFSLHEFNATPHFATPSGSGLMSYS